MQCFKHIFVFLILIFSLGCNAQKYSTKSKKAIASFEEARIHNDYGRFEEALVAIEKALKQDENFLEAYILRGYVYFDKKEFDLCIADFSRVLEVNPKMIIAYYNIAQAEVEADRYDDAINHLNKFLNQKDISPIAKRKAEHLLSVATFSSEAVKNPVPFNPINLGDSVNTEESEYWPTISTDNKTLIFTRLESKGKSSMGPIFKEDFYMTLKNNEGAWLEAKNVGGPINTRGNEGALALSPDGQFVFFVACNREDGVGDCDLYIAQRSGYLWKKPINLGKPVNSSTWESSPTFSSDGRTLYFSRGVGGRGSKNMDIYKTVFDGASWSIPVPVNELNKIGRAHV